jgi:hypothetical protein
MHIQALDLIVSDIGDQISGEPRQHHTDSDQASILALRRRPLGFGKHSPPFPQVMPEQGLRARFFSTELSLIKWAVSPSDWKMRRT